MWENLQASQLIEEFGRREPEALSHAPPPTKAQMDTLFAEPLTKCTVDSGGTPEEIAAQSQMQKWFADIANVATDESFVGNTPASEQELAAALNELQELMNENADLHKSCDFTLDNFDARQAALDQEMDGLREAKSVLAGSSLGGFLQK